MKCLPVSHSKRTMWFNMAVNLAGQTEQEHITGYKVYVRHRGQFVFGLQHSGFNHGFLWNWYFLYGDLNWGRSRDGWKEGRLTLLFHRKKTPVRCFTLEPVIVSTIFPGWIKRLFESSPIASIKPVWKSLFCSHRLSNSKTHPLIYLPTLPSGCSRSLSAEENKNK